MRIDGNLIFSVFVACIVLPKSSKQEKPEDCKKGQFWGHFAIDSGSCEPCPRFWQTCYEQKTIEDQENCAVSCHAKPTPKKFSSTSIKRHLAISSSYVPPALPNSASSVIKLSFTGFTPTFSYSSTLTNGLSTSSTLVQVKLPLTPARPKIRSTSSIPNVHGPSREPKKSHHNDQHPLIFVVVCALSLAVVFALVVSMIMLVRYRACERSAGNRRAKANPDECIALQGIQPNDAVEDLQPVNDVEEPVAPRELVGRPPVQAAPSSPRIGGIQEEYKHKGLSSLHLPETHS